MGKNINDLRWVDQLDTDEYYSITGKENGWGIRIEWPERTFPLLIYTTTANKPLPLGPCLEQELKNCFENAGITGTIYCEILGRNPQNHTRDGFEMAQNILSHVCEKTPLMLSTFEGAHLVIVALYESDRDDMRPTAGNRLQRLKQLPQIFTNDLGVTTYPEHSHVVCVEIIAEEVDQRLLVDIITRWLERCRLDKATPREGLVIRVEEGKLVKFESVARTARNYRSPVTWKVKQMCQQTVTILNSNLDGKIAMFKDASGKSVRTIPILSEMQQIVRVWNQKKEFVLEAKVLLIYEDVTKESPVRFAIVLSLCDKKHPIQKHNQQIDELRQKKEELVRARTLARGEDAEDVHAFVDELTLKECNRFIAIYEEERRARAELEELQAVERRELRVHSDYWAANAVREKEDELWRKGLGPKPDCCLPAVRELERQKRLERDRDEDVIRKQKKARDKALEKERSIQQEQKRRKEEDVLEREKKRKIDEQTAHEHYHWAYHHSTSDTLREAARVTLELHEMKNANVKHLQAHIDNMQCPFIEEGIRNAGVDIDRRLHLEKPQRERYYREAREIRRRYEHEQRHEQRIREPEDDHFAGQKATQAVVTHRTASKAATIAIHTADFIGKTMPANRVQSGAGSASRKTQQSSAFSSVPMPHDLRMRNAIPFVVNVPCGHVSVTEHKKCDKCHSSNDSTLSLPVETPQCAHEGCMRSASSMFVPCGCVVFCGEHAEAYIHQQPCHQVMCPNFWTADCSFHIDSITQILHDKSTVKR